MPCYSPLTGYRSRTLNANGNRQIVFNIAYGYADMEIKVPCGQCIGCRLEYSRQWAIRCVHELQMHKLSSFITLTYDEENLPTNQSISKREIQLFLKRLRKTTKTKIRYFGCGEYGDKHNRPHYHLIIYGYDFPDKKPHSQKNGNILYRSKQLEKIWPYGYSIIGQVTFESCAYVARYICKKQKGKDVPDYYEIADKKTGEIHKQQKEFALMSRKPGLGSTWYKKYKSDTDKDFITIRGMKMNIPKYYDSILKITLQEELETKKIKRKIAAKKNAADNTTSRLRAKEKVKIAQIKLLKRNIEE